MILPSGRWVAVAAGLALLAPLALVWPSFSLVLVGADLLWLLSFVLDAWRAAGVPKEAITVEREAPPAFSLGRSLPVRYRWANMSERAVELRVRESLPEMFGGWESTGGGSMALLMPPGGDAIRGLEVPALAPPPPGAVPHSRQVVLPTHMERWISIGPRGVAWEDMQLRPVKRGHARQGTLYMRRRSPWGLAWHQSKRDLPWKATVFPSLLEVSLRALPTQAQRRRETGLRNVRRLGEGRVFESLREWVSGDDTRAIDWKATARRGKPMARQYEDERRQHVLIVIDAGRMLTAESEGRPRLEAVIDAALQLAYAAVEHDDNVGLLVFADQVQHFVAPTRGRRAMRQVLDALATVEGRLVEPDYPAAFAFLAARNRKRALTVVFTDVIDRTASDALVAQVGSLRPRHLPLAVTLRNPDLDKLATARVTTVAGAFERAAAEELLQAREEALANMRTRGVLILDVPPSGAAKAVVDQYTLLKRRAAI